LKELNIREDEAPSYRRLLINTVVRGALVQDEFFHQQKVHGQWNEADRRNAVEAIKVQGEATLLALHVLFF